MKNYFFELEKRESKKLSSQKLFTRVDETELSVQSDYYKISLPYLQAVTKYLETI